MDDELSAEAEWIDRARSGDKNAFGLLVKKYMKQAYFAALGFLGSHDDALDASQEAFVKAYRALHAFDTKRRFYTWYYQILKNHCLNAMRERRGWSVSLSSLNEGAWDVASDDPHAEEMLQRRETRQAVWKALWNLSPEDRELIVARDMLETPYATLAELMECPQGTVMSRLFHARRRLRDRLGKEAR
jgi:RNA polymerase sigma-70 factor (ECF subfamily)